MNNCKPTFANPCIYFFFLTWKLNIFHLKCTLGVTPYQSVLRLLTFKNEHPFPLYEISHYLLSFLPSEHFPITNNISGIFL